MSKAARELRRRLAREQRMIERRLGDAVAPNLAGPVLGRANIGYEFAERSRGVAHGGMGMVAKVVGEVGLAVVSWLQRGLVVFAQVGWGFRVLAVYYLGDGDAELVDGVEGVGGVVVAGGLPCGGWVGGGDVADFVDEEVPPPVAWFGG